MMHDVRRRAAGERGDDETGDGDDGDGGGSVGMQIDINPAGTAADEPSAGTAGGSVRGSSATAAAGVNATEKGAFAP